MLTDCLNLELEEEPYKTANNAAKLVKAYNKLENEHKNELPQLVENVSKHIADLTDVLSSSTEK